MVSLTSGGKIPLSKLFTLMSSHSFQFLAACLMAMQSVQCQSNHSQAMDFETYDPVSTLVVPEHKLTKAKFPFIDVHNHQWSMGSQDLTNLITDMDKLNMKIMVNLSGGNGSGLQRMTENVKEHFPKRF